MKKSVAVLIAFGGAAAAAGTVLAQGQEQGRVISSTPVVQQVAVPRQVCSVEQVTVQTGKSGAGAAMGALAGGGLGNAMGQGSGKAALTMIGIVGGAVLGDKVEGGGTQTQNVQRCTTQTFYENRATAYNVVYEFNGKQYSVQMPNDPGAFVQLQVTPVGAGPAPAQPAITQQPPTAVPLSYAAPPTVNTATVVYAAPAYYAQPYYYPPFSTSINFGYSRGWYGGGGHHHWR